MTDTKHTPGPWQIAPGYEQRGKYAGMMGIAPTAGPVFALLKKPQTEGTRDIAEANARLIAAAPDLLSALENIAACEIGPDASGDDIYEAATTSVLVARAAIAKATGSDK